MKKSGPAFLIACLLFLLVTPVLADDDLKNHPSCKYCGMDRGRFAHSRMVIEYGDGTQVGTCSLHCAGIDLALNMDRIPRFIGVGDFFLKNLIDAEKAFWVLDGNKPGVMTKRAKWAFARKEEADKFMQVNGGTVVNFDEVLKAAYEDIADDTKMIRERRRMMREKMEKK